MEKPLPRRLAERGFPSVFQAGSPADEPKEVPADQLLARHDLIVDEPAFFGLRPGHAPGELADHFTPESVAAAQQRRAALLARNPNSILLATLHRRDSDPTRLVALAKATMASGALDGLMLDAGDDGEEHLALVRTLREAVGPSALLLVNAGNRLTPRTATFVNGYLLTCAQAKTPDDWRRLATTLEWAEKQLRVPRVNTVEGGWQTSRDDRRRMRLGTTLTLCLSDGYCLFSDPTTHRHRWYDFWNKSLGKPLARGAPLGMADRAHPLGWYRDFERGRVVCVLPDARPFELELGSPHRSAATGRISRAHTVSPGDGDLLLEHA